MSSSIDNITCPKCGGSALSETNHKTGEVYEHCTDKNCDYEEIVVKGDEEESEEGPTRYKLVNNQDGNDQIELESTTEEDATAEAFEALGWSLVAYTDE